MKESTTFDEYRVAYVSARWNVSDNCAKALQLCELGFSSSGIATTLGVTEGTARKYIDELADKIGEPAVYPVTSASDKSDLDIWGRRPADEYGTFGYSDGEAHGNVARRRSAECKATQSKQELDAKFWPEADQPALNKGIAFGEIPQELITIAPNVEVEQ